MITVGVHCKKGVFIFTWQCIFYHGFPSLHYRAFSTFFQKIHLSGISDISFFITVKWDRFRCRTPLCTTFQSTSCFNNWNISRTLEEWKPGFPLHQHFLPEADSGDNPPCWFWSEVRVRLPSSSLSKDNSDSSCPIGAWGPSGPWMAFLWRKNKERKKRTIETTHWRCIKVTPQNLWDCRINNRKAGNLQKSKQIANMEVCLTNKRGDVPYRHIVMK